MSSPEDRIRESQAENPEGEPRGKSAPGRDDAGEVRPERRSQEYPGEGAGSPESGEGSAGRPSKPSGEEVPEVE